MDISLFLAQAFGIFFVVGGLGLVMKQDVITKFFTRYTSNRADVMIGGFVALLVGTPLILIHNVWEGTWEVVVTVIVWVTFLKGVIRILAPDYVVALAHKMQHQEGLVKSMLWLMVALGGYLMYVGFGM